ncbi:hypothetical protein, partial [Pseudomonas syringae]|uniref:hypothetical protein n=1 Tax=Pseudomonas syringae TaxID=317 RepID=UPI000515EA80
MLADTPLTSRSALARDEAEPDAPDTPQRLNRGQAPLPQGMYFNAATPLTSGSALARDGVGSDDALPTDQPHHPVGAVLARDEAEPDSPDTPQRLNRGQAPLPQGMHS